MERAWEPTGRLGSGRTTVSGTSDRDAERQLSRGTETERRFGMESCDVAGHVTNDPATGRTGNGCH